MDTKPKSDKRAKQITKIVELIEENRVLQINIFMKLSQVVGVNTEMNELSKFLVYATPEHRGHPVN
jgi:hypothetical protein